MSDLKVEEHRWDAYLELFAPVDFLILEQVYVVERSPMALTELQLRLRYLNLSNRTLSRHVGRLGERGLVSQVTSCERFVNPIASQGRNVSLLVRIWRLRQERSLGAEGRNSGSVI